MLLVCVARKISATPASFNDVEEISKAAVKLGEIFKAQAESMPGLQSYQHSISRSNANVMSQLSQQLLSEGMPTASAVEDEQGSAGKRPRAEGAAGNGQSHDGPIS